MFVDEIILHCKGGKGGDGIVSFRSEKFIVKGGPNGGDGGKGGDVIINVNPNLRSFAHIRRQKYIQAENGMNGGSELKTGRSGQSYCIEVPSGTVITNIKSNIIVKDLNHKDDQYIIAVGGNGGKGNARFKSSINKTPRYCTSGKEGESIDIKLELKMIADIGLVGFPNVGKSTILSLISKAKPKIANYPFTTLEPNIGIVDVDEASGFIIADIPGIIENASKGVGLGIKFLKHIERNKALVFVLDSTEIEYSLYTQFELLWSELTLYSKNFINKDYIILINKSDLVKSSVLSNRVESFKDKVNKMILYKNYKKYKNIYVFSSFDKAKISNLKRILLKLI